MYAPTKSTNAPSSSSTPVAAEAAPNPFQAAFEATAADRAGIPDAELIPVNLDLDVVTTTLFAVIPRVMSLRPDIVRALQDFDITVLDKLELYTEALSYAHTVYRAVSTPPENLPKLGERAAALRDMLLADAMALALRGTIDRKRLDDLKGGKGYVATASDLGVLVRMLRERWADIAPRTSVQIAELEEAERVYQTILRVYGARTEPSPAIGFANEDRQRAFTVTLKAYDEVRRAVSYLRWHRDDADAFAPSLYARRRRNSSSDRANDANASPPAAANTNGTAHEPHAVVEPPPAPPTLPGFPGGSPFAHS